jgi:uncharacterized membrane protein
MFWIGGMIFTVLVLVPITRNKFVIPHKGAFFTIMGRKFSRLSWLLFMILIITGYVQLHHRGFTWSVLISSQFWHTHFGSILATKLLVFAAVLLMSGLHDFWLGPLAAKHIDHLPHAPKTQRLRKAVSWMGSLNLVLGLLILYYAFSLVRG